MRPIGLLKFGKAGNIAKLVEHGELFFNTVEYFQRNYQDGASRFRFDRFEGSSHLYQQKDLVKVTIAGRDYKPYGKGDPLLLYVDKENYFTHICCFTEVVNEPLVIEGTPRMFDPSMFQFGDAAAFVLDMKAFMDRILEFVKESKDIALLKADHVAYFDANSYSGETGAFRKAEAYSYQHEFRIALNTTVEDSYTMKIGSLSGIAFGPIDKSDIKNVIENDQAILS